MHIYLHTCIYYAYMCVCMYLPKPLPPTAADRITCPDWLSLSHMLHLQRGCS